MLTPLSVVHTQEELEALGHEWQKRLGLSDWEIHYQLVGRDEIDSQGTCTSSPTKDFSIIKLAKAECYDNPNWPLDHEKTIVHELLHCQFIVYDQIVDQMGDPNDGVTKIFKTAFYDRFEVAIDKTARALVRAKRGEKPVLSSKRT